MLYGLKLVELSPEAGAKYELIASELQELANLSHMTWGLISRNAFNLDMRIAFAAGSVVGLAAGGVIFAGKRAFEKIKRHKNKTEEES